MKLPEIESDKRQSLKDGLKRNGFISKVFNIIRPPDFKFGIVGRKQRSKFSEHLESLPGSGSVLNIGSGPEEEGNLKGLSGEVRRRLVALDYISQPGVDLRGDVAKLPFKDESFAGVLFQGVIEHIKDPEHALSEIHRILVPGGLVYVEAPFMQHYHKDPVDFRRYTVDGMDYQMKVFERLDSGVLYGPSAALADVLTEYAAVLFNFGLWYWGMKVLIGWLVFPLKFLDIFLVRKPQARYLCFGVYYVGRKSEKA